MVSASRNSRKREYKWFQARGTPANENTNGFGLAELPQMRIQMVSASRNFRKREYKWFRPRGIPANENTNGFSPAELPQMKIQIVSASRNFRKQKTKLFGALHCWQLKIRMNIHFKSNYK